MPTFSFWASTDYIIMSVARLCDFLHHIKELQNPSRFLKFLAHTEPLAAGASKPFVVVVYV